MQIDWWTLGLQAVNFAVLVWLLQRFLYKPVREVIEKRKQLAEQAFAQAEAKGQEAEAERRKFEANQAALAEERQELLKKLHQEADAERQKLLKDTKQEADAMLEDARETIAGERREALKQVRGQVAELAAELAAGLLSKAGPGTAQDVFLDALEQQLAEMDAEERTRLQKDLAAEGACLTIVTAHPLDAKARKQWSGRLSANLDYGGKTEFATDAEILGGAELRFPHAVVKYTWADQLRQAEELLRRDEPVS